jgi:hypothetical protein
MARVKARLRANPWTRWSLWNGTIPANLLVTIAKDARQEP